MRVWRNALVATMLFLCAGALAAAAQTTALVGGTVHPVSGPALEDAILVMQGAEIVEVQSGGTPPAGATIVDVSGLHVYPGMIDPNSVLGLIEVSSVPGTRDVSELGEINPNVRPEVAINPDSELLPVTMSNGVLYAMIAPRGGLIAGTAAVIRLEGWTWEDMTLQAPVGLLVNWPSMRITETEDKKKRKKQIEARDENMRRLREAFADARAYRKALEAEGTRGIPHHDRDPRWEAMLPVLRQEIPVLVATDGVLEDLRAILRWTEEEDVDVVLIAGGDVWRVADELAARDIPVILQPTHDLPQRRWEPYDAAFTIANKLYEAGVRFCFSHSSSGFGAAHARNLPYHAATAAAYGLPKHEALRGVTQSTADILGVGDRLGTLEVGKEATLIVTDGDPLEIRTQVVRAWLAGSELDLDDRHKRLVEKYRSRPRPDTQPQPAEEAITERE